jgi:hypothetical protein
MGESVGCRMECNAFYKFINNEKKTSGVKRGHGIQGQYFI